MIVLPFGTNGFFPSFGRATACYGIVFREILIILDAGSGLFRLAEPEGQKLLNRVKDVHLYLSHYHLDHTFGFYAAFKLLKDKKVMVFAESGRQVFWEFVTLKHFPVNYTKVHKNFAWKTLKEGKNNISDYHVYVRKQYHRGEGSFAFRFVFPKKNLAYVTDSEPTRESIEFVRGADLLLHEHDTSGEDIVREKGLTSIEDHFNGNHVTSVGAALIAKKAQVDKLVLIHHSAFYDEKRLQHQLKIARKIFSKTILAQDLKAIEF